MRQFINETKFVIILPLLRIWINSTGTYRIRSQLQDFANLDPDPTACTVHTDKNRGILVHYKFNDF